MANTSLGNAYVQIMPSAQGIKGAITGVLSQETEDAGKQAGGRLTNLLKSAGESGGKLAGLKLGAGIVANVASAGVAAGARLVGALKNSLMNGTLGDVFRSALDAGAALQQSYGGLDTLYGEAAGAAKAFAAEAAAAGISANDYAEQAVSFGASLKQAFGGDAQAAVEAANTAILDMADNAAKMGTPIESIQAAYQGFARGQYTLLDNLKLGYGGTKEEMQRLLADAQALTGVEYNIDNLGDVYAAIHVIQEDLGLTGVAAAEASTTFSGSLAAMQAAGQNLLANLALGEDIGPSLQTLITAVETFAFNNLFPMVGNILAQLPQLIGDALMRIMGEIPGMAESAITFINNLAAGITEGTGTISETLTNIGHAALEMFKSIDWAGLGSAVINLIGSGLSFLAEAIPTILQGIGSAAMEFFESVDWVGLGKTVIGLIGDGIQWVIDNVPNMLLNIATSALEFFKSVDWAGIGTAVIGLIGDGIQWVVDNVPDLILSIATTAAEWFEGIDWSDLGSKVIGMIVEGIQWMFDNIPDLLLDIANTALEWFENVDWLELGQNVINFIIDGITDLLNDIPETMENIANTAVEWFESVDWLDVGINIVEGIIDGIWSAASNLWDTVTSLASGAEDRAESWLGIASPSKVFRDDVGRWIPAGIAEGIEEGAGDVQNALQGIAQESVNTMGGMDLTGNYTPGAAGSGAVSYTNYFEITQQPGQSARELAQEVINLMKLNEQQAAAVWG